MVACNRSSRNTPEDAAKRWLSAMLEWDDEKLVDLTCQKLTTNFEAFADFGPGEDYSSEYDINDYGFETIESTDTTAAVEITELYDQPLIVYMVLEKNGMREEWKFCGFDPEAIGKVFEEIIESLENP